jgi:decaprenylphospho-beta-D-erythro-pentofuranosid-2-ulose 2-reductase
MSKSNSQWSVIYGATSAVAQALARQHAKNGDSLILVARNAGRCSIVAHDLEARGATKVITLNYDLGAISDHEMLLSDIESITSEIDIHYLFYGVLPNQELCEKSWESTLASFNINFISASSLLSRLANKMEVQGRGTIVAVSSVAGDRARQSNYIYGTAKGALTLFLQGLRNRLHKSGVSVLTVKPGFIDTPMTANLEKGGPLWATPEKVAADIYNAVKKQKNIIYTPWFWQFIMLIIRVIPETIFKRLKL